MTASATSSLWMFHSKVLGGFYQSHVIVIAPDRDAAVEQAVHAINDHIDETIAEMFFCSMDGTMLDPDDETYLEQRTEVMERLRAEAQEKITRIETGRLVMHSS